MAKSGNRLIGWIVLGVAIGGVGLVIVAGISAAVVGGLLASRTAAQKQDALEALEREQQAILEEMEQSEQQFTSDAQRATEDYEALAEELIAGAAAGDTAAIEQLAGQAQAMGQDIQDSADRMADQHEQAAKEMEKSGRRAAGK